MSFLLKYQCRIKIVKCLADLKLLHFPFQITELVSAVIPFLDNGLSERKTIESLLVNAIDFLEEAGRNVNYKVVFYISLLV